MDSGLVEAFVEDANNGGAEERSEERAATAAETGAPHSRRRDGGQFEALATGGFGTIKLRGLDRAGDARERAAQDISNRLDASHGNAREARGLAISPKRVE